MKVCGGCGEQYNQWVDFCFGDGEILVPLDATESPLTADAGRERLRGLSKDPPGRPLATEPGDEAPRFIVLREPPPDRSSLSMAGATLVFMALIVPLIGGLLFGSMTSHEPEAGTADPPTIER